MHAVLQPNSRYARLVSLVGCDKKSSRVPIRFLARSDGTTEPAGGDPGVVRASLRSAICPKIPEPLTRKQLQKFRTKISVLVHHRMSTALAC